MSVEEFLGGSGFAAFGRKFEGPPPLDVFDTFPKQRTSALDLKGSSMMDVL